MANTDAWRAPGRSSFVRNLAMQPGAPAVGARLFAEPTYRFLLELEPVLKRAIPVLIVVFLGVIAIARAVSLDASRDDIERNARPCWRWSPASCPTP